MKLFHRDYLDIQRNQPLSAQELKDQSLFDFFNMNSLTKELVTMRAENQNQQVQPRLFR